MEPEPWQMGDGQRRCRWKNSTQKRHEQAADVFAGDCAVGTARRIGKDRNRIRDDDGHVETADGVLDIQELGRI